MNTKKYFLAFFVAVVSSVLAVIVYSNIVEPEKEVRYVHESSVPVANVNLPQSNGQLPDLTYASEKSVHAVVHVKTVSRGQSYGGSGNPLFDYFFGPGSGYNREPAPVMGAGSGVILTTDGYIVTNNHVIDGAEQIEVVLNDKRTFTAELVGTDPNSDIALLKVDAKNLPYLSYGDSDGLKVGEWVLAVGNPFNLTSTVTAGIVSAKARSINIIANGRQNYGIESFIQTDAAVNPGNSGGALVNQRGELVGINTAIASRTGSYSGYSFAVPVSIAKKVVADLMEYGEVQRALLGVSILDVSKESLAQFELDPMEKMEGVLVGGVSENGGAAEAGIRKADIILSVDGDKVNSVPQLQERVSRHRPGEVVNIMVLRDGKKKTFNVTLRNIRGTTGILTRTSDDLTLGATLKELSDKEMYRLGIRYGIQVESLSEGSLQNSGIKEGYIITKANKIAIESVEDFKEVVKNVEIGDGLFLTGIYPNGRVAYYAINIHE